MNSVKQNDTTAIIKAKRLFLRNLVLFSLVALCVAYFHYSAVTDTPPATQATAERSPQKTSPTENAALLGEAHGLDEDPRDYKLPDKRLREEAIKAIRRNIKVIKPQDEQALVDAYCEGYHARFMETYRSRDGHEAGYLYGRSIHSKSDEPDGKSKNYAVQHTPDYVAKSLLQYKERAIKKYTLDEAQWILFKRDFLLGYTAGYATHTSEGSIQSDDTIEMIEP